MPRLFIAISLPLLVTSLLLLAGCASRPTVVRGELRGPLVWEGEVRISGDVVLGEGSDLVIRPGTTVLFLDPAPGEDRLSEHPNFPGSELIVRGHLRAEGTASSPITFRHAETSAPAGSWGGINLEKSPGATFRHCRFTQADSALHSQESRALVEQSLFEGNRVGVRFHSSAMRIAHNLFRENGTAIRFHFGAPSILANRLEGNGKGFFITSHPEDYLIEGNSVTGSREYSVVLGEEVPEDVDLAGNYWGSVDPAVIEEGFFDGRREGHLGRVRYRPFVLSPIAEAGPTWNR